MENLKYIRAEAKKFYEHWKFQRNRSIPLEEDKLDNFNMYEMLDKLKALLQYAIFLSTCLAISLGQKLHESLPSVTCSKMNMSRNFLLPQSLREVEVDSTSRNGDCNKNVARHVISRHVTLGNDSDNLCRNVATKLRDKLQEKLPSVRAPLTDDPELTLLLC